MFGNLYFKLVNIVSYNMEMNMEHGTWKQYTNE